MPKDSRRKIVPAAQFAERLLVWRGMRLFNVIVLKFWRVRAVQVGAHRNCQIYRRGAL